jgi:hypothetical protein
MRCSRHAAQFLKENVPKRMAVGAESLEEGFALVRELSSSRLISEAHDRVRAALHEFHVVMRL